MAMYILMLVIAFMACSCGDSVKNKKLETHIEFTDDEVPTHKVIWSNGEYKVILDGQFKQSNVNVINQ